MNYFILLETATDVCSVAIADQNKILIAREVREPKVHASMLAPMIAESLDELDLRVSDCSAVAVSKGPGSYTGLRVGVSTAKGLCLGANIPLIGVGTLDILAEMGKRQASSDSLIVPMIDARRMDVYTAVYNPDCGRISEIEAATLDENSFAEEFERYPSIVFIGDGVEKFGNCLSEERLAKSTFIPARPSVYGMFPPLMEKWREEEFEDTAYFEPFYLKEFVAGISKKNENTLLGKR